MKKISVVGIDKSGKSSLVKSFEDDPRISCLYLAYSRNPGALRKAISSVARFGERRKMKKLTASAYLMFLAPYFMEERRSKHEVVLSDRDPILDTFVYLKSYLPETGRSIKPLIQYPLEKIFQYPDQFIFLSLPPEVAVARCNQKQQIHENLQDLERLQSVFEEELFRVKKKGISVYRINAERSQEEIREEVGYMLRGHIFQKS